MTFETKHWISGLIVLGPLIGLIAVGLWIALRSGTVGLDARRKLATLRQNVAETIVLIVAWVCGLAAVQEFIGIRMSMGW